jgi:hypothetical protein
VLTLSAKQFQHLADLTRLRFEAESWEHVGTHYSDRVSALGETRARSLMRFALDEASRFAFTREPEVLKYLNLVFEFGPAFPDDARFSWAREILVTDGPDRMDRLYAAALGQVR